MLKIKHLLLLCLLMISISINAQDKPILPDDLVWETNDEDPTFADPNAQKGGTFRSFVNAFPLTLRTVGPDSNTSFRSYRDSNRMSLVSIHPNTRSFIPSLATHWYLDPNGKTVFFKLNPTARWSDGKPVTADDYLFTLSFMRSKHIVAPWYNNHYTKEIVDVIKYDDYTIAVVGGSVKPTSDMLLYYNLAPIPRHFHKLDKNWVKDYNWKIAPNTGPYQISEVKKGKHIIFKRKKDWWAEDLKYYKNIYNINKVKITVIRDLNVAYNTFLKGKLDAFQMIRPDFWYGKTDKPEFKNGYINRIWFYNDTPQPSYGIWLNQDYELFKDKNVRYGFAHAMNIQKMIDTILRGDYVRLHNHYTGYGKYTNPNVRAREFSLEKAGVYFDKAGWNLRDRDGVRLKDSKRLSVKVTYSQQEHTDRLVVLKEEALKSGLELELQLLDGTSAYKNVQEKKHQAAWSGWAVGLRPAFWQHYHSDNAHKPQTNNITNTDDPQLDKKIMTYRAATKEDERIQLAHEIQQKLYEIGGYIPTYSVPYVREAYWRWIKLPDWYGTRMSGFDYPSLVHPIFEGLSWIDEEEKENTLKAKKKGKKFEPVIILDETYKPH